MENYCQGAGRQLNTRRVISKSGITSTLQYNCVYFQTPCNVEVFKIPVFLGLAQGGATMSCLSCKDDLVQGWAKSLTGGQQ